MTSYDVELHDLVRPKIDTQPSMTWTRCIADDRHHNYADRDTYWPYSPYHRRHGHARSGGCRIARRLRRTGAGIGGRAFVHILCLWGPWTCRVAVRHPLRG